MTSEHYIRGIVDFDAVKNLQLVYRLDIVDDRPISLAMPVPIPALPNGERGALDEVYNRAQAAKPELRLLLCHHRDKVMAGALASWREGHLEFSIDIP
jgi:hypothetical protein